MRCCGAESVRVFVDRARLALPDFEVDADNAARARRDLPPARRHRAGDRAGRRARHDAVGGRHRGAPGRPLPPAHRRQPRAAAPPDAARGDAMELRAADAGASSACCARCRCSPAAGRCRPRRRSRRPSTSTRRWRCLTALHDKSLLDGRSRGHAAAARATACSRRCASTRCERLNECGEGEAAREPARWPISSRWPKTPSRICAGPSRTLWMGRLQAGTREPGRSARPGAAKARSIRSAGLRLAAATGYYWGWNSVELGYRLTRRRARTRPRRGRHARAA